MATPAETVDQIIADAQEIADDHMGQMERYTDFGINIATGGPQTVVNPYTWLTTQGQLLKRGVTSVDSGKYGWMSQEPAVPTAESPTDLYETYRDELIATLAGLLADFYDTYFPITNDGYDPAVAWIVNTITNGGTGIPAAIEDQIWQRARTRIIKEGSRVEAQLTSGFAAKGFSLPPGVMNKGIKEIRHAQLSSLGEQSTDIAVKQIEIEITNIKFAVEKGLETRIAAIGAANDYIRAMALAPEIATKLTETDSSVQARLMSATADMYRARISRDQLVLNSELAQMGQFTGDQKVYWDTLTQRNSIATNGTLTGAASYAKTAQSALAALNTVASVASSSFE
jgi:hypothetical protein